MGIAAISFASSAAYAPLSQSADMAPTPAQIATAQQYTPPPVTPRIQPTSQYHQHQHRYRGDDVASPSASSATQSGTIALNTLV